MILVIYLFLSLQIGIQAESSSFIQLIPNLIANGQFVQDNIIDSNIEFNQTLPWINLDLKFDAYQSNCSRDIGILERDLRARKTWALKTLDAWGKFPSGIMQGNIYWIGSPYECGHHLSSFINTVVEQPFQTRTCIVGNSYPTRVGLVYGICVPRSCNATDILHYINHHTIRIPFIKKFIHLTNDSIHCIDDRSYDTKAILTIVILTLIAFLMLVATGMHISYGHKMDATSPAVYEPILSRSMTATETSITTDTITTTTINTLLQAEEDESTPLIVRSEPAVDSVAQKLISCCSLMNNYHILKLAIKPKNLAYLNGIRVLSLCWVILGHTFLFAAIYSDNVLTVFNWSRQLWFQIIIQAVFSVDTFFILSGLLTTFLFFIWKIENENFSILKFFLNHYVYRYLRYTILYAIILLFYITLSPYLGQDGPIYPADGSEASACRRTWWRNLLYINNFFNQDDSCMPVTWYLAVNMQFHWIAPLFLLAVSWNWFLGLLVTTAFLIIDLITTSVIVSKNNYDHGIFSDFHLNQSNTSHKYLTDVYIKPWCRIGPYAIGLLLGYVLYEMYQCSNNLSWESLIPQPRANRIKQILAWILALVILSLCVFGTYGDYNGHSLTRSGRIAFLALSRLGWSIGLSMIIILCFVGQGGIVNHFLSHSFFHLLSKLTYGAYLWHSLVLFVNYLSRDQPNHYAIANILFNFILHIILSYILSFFTYLLIELPVIQLLKIAFQRRTIHQN